MTLLNMRQSQSYPYAWCSTCARTTHIDQGYESRRSSAELTVSWATSSYVSELCQWYP